MQFGKVCPGRVYCGELMHWSLIVFELFGAFVICLLLLPFVVRARVQHAYG